MNKINKEKLLDSPSQPVPSRGGVILGKQSNHGDFYLPACLSHLVNPPLYIAVAWWGLLSGKGISREDISRAFRIPPRRAADVMAYILRERGDVIGCTRKILRESGRRSLVLTITDVRDDGSAPALPPTRGTKTSAAKQSSVVREWRQWFLRRPNSAPEK